jgi:hypothetical protein
MVLGHPASPQAFIGILPSVAINAILGRVGRNVANTMGAYNFKSKLSQRLLNILQKRELTGVFTDLSSSENLGNRSTFGYLCAVWNEQWKVGLLGAGMTKKQSISEVRKESLLKGFIRGLVQFPLSRWVLNFVMYLMPGNGKIGLKANSVVATLLGKLPIVGSFLKEKTLVLAKMKGLYFKTPHDVQQLTYVKTGKQVKSILADGSVQWEDIYTSLVQTHVSANEKTSAIGYGLYQLLKISPDKGVGVWVQRWNHANAPLANTLWDAAQSGNFWRALGAGATHYTNWVVALASENVLSYAGGQVLAQNLPPNMNATLAEGIKIAWVKVAMPLIQVSLPNLVQKPLLWANFQGASVGYNLLNKPSSPNTN